MQTTVICMAVELLTNMGESLSRQTLACTQQSQKKHTGLGVLQTSVQDKLGMHRKQVDEVDSHPVREVDTSLDACSDARLHSKAMPSNVH